MKQDICLADNAKITVKAGLPCLEIDNHLVHQLQLGEAISLGFLSALGQREKAVEASRNFIPDSDAWVDHVIDRYWTYLGGRKLQNLNFDWIEQVDFDRLMLSPRGRREAAPRAIVWLVTLGCNRRCPYCFYDVSKHNTTRTEWPSDAEFSTEAVFRMIAEMSDIGTADLYLTGGEPLLRPDLIEILVEADRRRIRTHISTKYPIDLNLARQLEAANPASLTYSLDAGNSRTADGLSGTKGFLKEAISSLKNLISVGIDPEVNAVLTSANYHELDSLIALIVDCGVTKFSASEFIAPISDRSSTSTLLLSQSSDEIEKEIKALAERWIGKIDVRLGDSAQNGSSQSEADHAVCEVGFTELHVLPNGSATRCRYLPDIKQLQVGSLEDSSIMEIWQGRLLHNRVFPNQSSYEGSDCSSCGSFGSCNERGRCYLSALTKNGELNAPDDFCSRSVS